MVNETTWYRDESVRLSVFGEDGRHRFFAKEEFLSLCPSVLKVHALFARRSGKVLLRDCGSRNAPPGSRPVVAREHRERPTMRNHVLLPLGRGVLSAIAFTLLAAAAPIAAQSYEVLHPFISAQQNPGGLVQASDGNFYGTTAQGGANGLGSVFRITSAGTLTTLYSFEGSDGRSPQGTLVQGSDGNLYGTTTYGGAGGYGTVFTITTAGALTTLYSFAGSSDGTYPYAGVVQGTDGNFYGTTNQGGTSGSGTVFTITTAGALTTLYSFAGSDGAYPQGGLVQGTDGNFYGTTNQGGTSDFGTVFTITPAGALTTLYSFAGSDGAYPYAGLVQGTDGNFYGTTYQGGTSDSGAVFTITTAGVLTTLYSFANSSDGSYPYAGLIQGTDGNFYGTTSSGGTNGVGTVFRITTAGALTTLHSFAYSSDGGSPNAGLVQGTDGNLYGTTTQGGATGNGTVFRTTTAGALTTLHSFLSSDGAKDRKSTRLNSSHPD
jgi:uncharacterized repeat protein (TIGR03803 family)